jgi:hypothetical protein
MEVPRGLKVAIGQSGSQAIGESHGETRAGRTYQDVPGRGGGLQGSEGEDDSWIVASPAWASTSFHLDLACSGYLRMDLSFSFASHFAYPLVSLFVLASLAHLFHPDLRSSILDSTSNSTRTSNLDRNL